MLPQPRKSGKAKKSKRSSLPVHSLSKDVKKVQKMQTIQSVESMKAEAVQKNDTEDLLDLFDFDNKKQEKENKNKNEKKAADDFFDLFDDNTSSSKPMNTLQIHPNLMNPRESRSLQPDKLFDVAMWQNFDEQQNQTNDKQQQQQNARNTTLNFEPINTAKSKKKQKQRQKEEEEEEEEEETDSEEDEDEDDEKEKEKEKMSKSKTISKKAPKKPRASAPPTTISSAINGNKKSEKDKVKKKESNALEELHRGAALLKYPRRSGFPHFKHIQLSQDNLRIEWFSKRKNLNQTCIFIKDIREVVRGQETEVFKKFHQKTLEKSSFSVVYGHSYKTLDVAAKSIDECEMWVKCILKLVEIYKANKRETDLTKLTEIFVGINFKDRNRPSSRQGSGNFIRANSSKTLKIDPVALKEIERDMESLHKTYHKTAQLAQKPVITKSNQYSNIQYVLSELEERIEELTYEVANIRDTELAKREVWRANVDLSAIQEKVEVLTKHLSSKSDRRKSNFI